MEVPGSALSPGNVNLEHFCTEGVPRWVHMHDVYLFTGMLDSSCAVLGAKSLSVLESTYKLQRFCWAITNFRCNSVETNVYYEVNFFSVLGVSESHRGILNQENL